MRCDCQLGRFDCEEKVRRFLGVHRESAGADLAARDELIERMGPLIERAINRRLQGNWRKYQADAIQNTYAKLCNPQKIQTWLDRQDRQAGAPFCHWVAVVAFHEAINVTPPPPPPPPGPRPPGDDPMLESERREQATKLRDTIRAALREFPLEWGLAYYMKCSYLKPRISDIASAVGIAEETVHWRVREMNKRIRSRYAEPIPPEVGNVAFPGTRHPVEDFDRLEPAKRKRLNEQINQLLAARSIQEQFALYARYSPLALGVDAIAVQVGGDSETVRKWLRQIET